MLNYPQTLVYMLQACEYKIDDYLAWYHRTKNFGAVEKRKHLIKTPKSQLMLIAAWLIIFSLVGLAGYIVWRGNGSIKYVLAFLIILTLPRLVAYGIIGPLLIGAVIQWPSEYLIIQKTKEKLKRHKGLKIGIAGSFGKTSMREILKTVLATGKKVAAAPHNFNTPLGIGKFAKSLKGDEEILIFEMGEYYPGDIKKLCEIVKPEIGIITGINEAHLQKFKTLDKTVGTIMELAEFMKGKTIYINGENELSRKNKGSSHKLYNRNQVGEWKIENQKTDLTGTEFTLIRNKDKLKVKSGLLGCHQIGPLAVAADIGLRVGLSNEQILEGIGKTKAFEHRLEPKTDSNGVIILDDSYNGNPDGVGAVIDFLATIKNHRRWYLTPGLVEMGTKAEEAHRQIGERLAKAKIEKVILIKNRVTPWIEEGLKKAEFKGEIVWFDEALEALAAIPTLTTPGDIILIQNDWPDQY